MRTVHGGPRRAVVTLVALGLLVLAPAGDHPSADRCGLGAKLVPSCGLLLGAWSNGHGVSGLKAQILEHERRIGRRLRIVHAYHPPAGPPPLTADERWFAARADTLVWVTWRPAVRWADAAGGDAAVDARIAAAADSIRRVAPRQVMLTIEGEPEHQLVAGSAACPVDARHRYGTAGTPAAYRAMWRHVRAIFDARGAGNVVWNMTYTGSVATWACAVKDLWPGNDLVDWVTWDPYSLDGVKTWDQTVGGFYDWLSANSDPGHDFVSKPWGLGEFGVGGRATRAFEARFYADAKAAVDAGRFPRLKAYVVFDAVGAFETRTDHDPHGAPNLAEQAAYDAFANDPRFLR